MRSWLALSLFVTMLIGCSRSNSSQEVEYLFNEPKNQATFSCVHVINDNQNILFGSLDNENYWTFHCGRQDHSTSEILLVSMQQCFEADSSISLISNLNQGQSAIKKTKNDTWEIIPVN